MVGPTVAWFLLRNLYGTGLQAGRSDAEGHRGLQVNDAGHGAGKRQHVARG